MAAEISRRSITLLRHRVRTAAHRIVADCEALLADATRTDWPLWRDAIGEGLLAGYQLRAVVERRFASPAAQFGPDDVGALYAEMREPQRHVVVAMTRLLSFVPTTLEDELLLGEARAIREIALRLGNDDATLMVPGTSAVPRESAPAWTSSEAVKRAVAPEQERILVVDDMEAPRQVIARLLERLDYEVLTAASGLDALAIVQRERIDLIISDIEMPECDGFTLLQRLKENKSTQEIPVIVLSGLDDTASIVRCIELGAEDHLSKPLNSRLMQARVRTSLDRKRMRDHELEYLSRVARLTAAAEQVENATYQTASIANLKGHDDELGRLARVFDRVVSGLQSREAHLQRRLRQFGDEIRRSTKVPSLELELLPGLDVLVVGDVIAERYEILEELGRGGMGVVYRARDRELGEEVAVKLLRSPLLTAHPELIERLKMEIRLARKITHQNVVRSHDFGEWNGTYFLTMEFVKGITVESLLETQGRLSVASTLAIGTQLAEALAIAHDQQIIHRDIKPANLLVNNDGVLKVTDFGLARRIDNTAGLTQHGSVVGTPRYMAPEQLFGETVNEKSDLFSVGAVLYECLTGLPPFDANSATEIVAKLVDGPPPPIDSIVADVPPALVSLIARLLSYEPRDRPQSARELAEKLHEIA